MAHSNQIREFMLTPHGIELVDAYVGPAGVLTGSARAAQEARDAAAEREHEQQIQVSLRRLERKRQAMEAQIAALHAAFEVERLEEQRLIEESHVRDEALRDDRAAMAHRRQASRGPAGGRHK
jgi:circadian clock protein KaiC